MAITLPQLPNPVAWFSHRDPTQATTDHRRIGQWRLVIVHDPLTGKTQCSLRTRAMSYGPAAMLFRFGAHTDTFGAVYQIDDSPAVSWRTNAMTLAARGVRLQTDQLNNPSGGVVAVPTTALAGAHSVVIRPSPTTAARTFRLDDLPAALDQAQTAGCAPEFNAAASE